MSPSGPYRLASSVAVLLASPKLGAVKRTFLLCSKGTLSLCRVSGPLPPQRLRLAPRVLLARPVTHPEISLTPCKHASQAINSPWQSGLACYSQHGKSVAGFTPKARALQLDRLGNTTDLTASSGQQVRPKRQVSRQNTVPMAILDACVLVQAPLRDTLLRLAEPPSLY